MTNTRITDPEVLERRYPVLLHEFSIRDGSGGDGLYHGGDGVVRDIEFLEPIQASILSEVSDVSEVSDEAIALNEYRQVKADLPSRTFLPSSLPRQLDPLFVFFSLNQLLTSHFSRLSPITRLPPSLAPPA